MKYHHNTLITSHDLAFFVSPLTQGFVFINIIHSHTGDEVNWNKWSQTTSGSCNFVYAALYDNDHASFQREDFIPNSGLKPWVQAVPMYRISIWNTRSTKANRNKYPISSAILRERLSSPYVQNYRCYCCIGICKIIRYHGSFNKLGIEWAIRTIQTISLAIIRERKWTNFYFSVGTHDRSYLDLMEKKRTKSLQSNKTRNSFHLWRSLAERRGENLREEAVASVLVTDKVPGRGWFIEPSIGQGGNLKVSKLLYRFWIRYPV